MATYDPTVWVGGVGGTELTTTRFNKIEQAIRTLYDNVPDDGVTDAGPAIQALYDAGYPCVLNAKGSYLINTPVFFDRADAYRSYTIELNGGKIILGPGLPTTAGDSFYRDAATTFAFFANTKRTAFNSGTNVVTLSDANRGSGPSVGNLMSVVVQNGTVAGAGRNSGLMFGNRTGARFIRVILSGARCLWSFTDYSDCSTFDQCHNRRDTEVTNSALFIQINNGDGVEIHGCKADGGMMIADMRYCRGANVTGNVTGAFRFWDCNAIVMTSCHQEANISNEINVKIVNSNVTVIGSVFYPARSSTVAVFDIADDNSNASCLSLIDVITQYFYSSGTTPDAPWGPLVSMSAANPGTKLRVRGGHGKLVASGDTTGGWMPTCGPLYTAAATSIQTALANAASAAQIASGNFDLERYGGTAGSSVWAALPPGELVQAQRTRVMGSPQLVALNGGTRLTGGTLSTSTTYYYTCAVKDARGNTTIKSTEVSATGFTTIRLNANISSRGRLCIWRGTSAGTYDRYIELDAPYAVIYEWDTGTCIHGQLWKTTGIPTPPAANTTVNSMTIDGTVVP